MRAEEASFDRPQRRAITAVLDAVARNPSLYNDYVLKGGLALQLAYGSPRRSDDLDFNAVNPTANEITEVTKQRLLDVSGRLDAALKSVAPDHRFTTLTAERVQLSSEIPTLMTDVAFVTDDGTSGTVKLQVTLSEIVCETTVSRHGGLQIHAASLEDIIAEKLKALLQQITRDKVRSPDVFDVWYFTTESETYVDPSAVSQYVLEKRKQWASMPSLNKGQFRRKSVVQHAGEDYSKLAEQLPESFELVPFREAYDGVLQFVDRLDLPE